MHASLLYYVYNIHTLTVKYMDIVAFNNLFFFFFGSYIPRDRNVKIQQQRSHHITLCRYIYILHRHWVFYIDRVIESVSQSIV